MPDIPSLDELLKVEEFRRYLEINLKVFYSYYLIRHGELRGSVKDRKWMVERMHLTGGE